MQFNIIELDETTSTNDVAATGDYRQGTIIIARTQTAGRGQRGSVWESLPGENLTFSLVIEPLHIAPDRQFLISMTAALAVSDALIAAGVGCEVKWPNDLYAGDKKIGGILIENSLMGEHFTGSIIGIGINVLQTRFDPSLPNPTSVAAQTGRTDFLPGDLLKEFCGAFEKRYSQSPAALHGDYMKRLWRGSGFHPFSEGGHGEPFMAAIESIDPYSGMLTLGLEDGSRREYWFKEVAFLL